MKFDLFLMSLNTCFGPYLLICMQTNQYMHTYTYVHPNTHTYTMTKHSLHAYTHCRGKSLPLIARNHSNHEFPDAKSLYFIDGDTKAEIHAEHLTIILVTLIFILFLNNGLIYRCLALHLHTVCPKTYSWVLYNSF